MQLSVLALLLPLGATPLQGNASDAQADARVDVDVPQLLDEMLDRSAAARGEGPAFEALSQSSTDPRSTDPSDAATWFSGDDAGHFAGEHTFDERTEDVLLEANGPGALVRIWSGNPRGTLRVYVDGTLAIEQDMAALLTGRGPVTPPLAAERSLGANLYFPIPYASRCVVTCDARGHPLYYQIEYRSYAPETRVRAFAPGDFEVHAAQADATGRALLTPAADEADAVLPFQFELTPAAQPPVRALELDVAANVGAPPGPRAITELRLALECFGANGAERREQVLRQTVLSIAFDGQRTVHVPVGDFFGTAPGARAYQSWPLTVAPDGELVARFWMPYRESCVVRIEGAGRERIAVRGSVSTRAIAWSDDMLHFHARWTAAPTFATRPPRDWTMLDVQGRGVYVGDMLSVANPLLSWWGEGDEKIYVDGDAAPAHFGTGTDDYYGFAFSSPQPFQAPFHNQTRCDGPQNFGHTSLNRFRSLDRIPFASGLRFDLGIVHWGDAELALAATTYFYAELAAAANTADVLAAASSGVTRLTYDPFRVAGAVEFEQLAVAGRSEGLPLETEYHDPRPEGAWSGGTVQRVRASQPGQFVEWQLPPAEAGERTATVYLSGLAEGGTVQFFLNGTPIGEAIDTYRDSAAALPPEAFALPAWSSDGQAAVLRAELVSTNEHSRPPHYALLVDCIVIE